MGIQPFIVSGILLVSGSCAMAQQPAGDTVLKGSTIEVIQSYKPQVRKAPKPEWLPQLPPADTTRPVLNYDVPQQTLYYSYTSGALRPLALGRDTLAMPYQNYIKAGGGNLSTLYLDAGIGALKGKTYETAIHLHHISQKGSLSNQQSALSGLEAEGALHRGNYDWHARADLERNQYYFYGSDGLIPVPGPVKDLKQTYTLARLAADMTDRTRTGLGQIIYHPSIAASVYDARFNAGETKIDINVPISCRLDSALTLETIAAASVDQFKMTDASTNSNLAMLKPGIALDGKLSGHAMLGFAAGRGGNFYVLPEIVASYRIPSTSLTLTGGWMSSIRQNTYEQLTTENPYLQTTYTSLFAGAGLRQTRKDELFASVTGGQGKHLTYYVKAGWLNFTNLATFINTPAPPVMFYVVYDDVSAISVQAAARYAQANTWSAGVSVDFNKYYQGSQPYAWHQPATCIKGDVSAAPVKDLSVTAYISILGGIYAINRNGNAAVLSPITDIGIYGEYLLRPRLSVFLQGSNLLNSNYERWSGYQSYGLNVYGGLRLKF